MADPRTKYWFDTEFMEDGKHIDLLSIGIVCEDGRQFYGENIDADLSKANEWVMGNVIPYLWGNLAMTELADTWLHEPNHWGGPFHKIDLARRIKSFIADGDYPPEFWTYFGAYDWVVLMQLYGPMIDKPETWPYGPMDIQQLIVEQDYPVLPEQFGRLHNALSDAIWTKEAWEYLTADKTPRERDGT